MKPLSFAGFLKQYLKVLSEQNSLNVFTLAREAAVKNPRLREPLTLYAVFCDKVSLLRRADKHGWLDAFMLEYSTAEMMQMLENNSDKIPENYKKVYRSFSSVSSKKQNEAHTKALMQARIRELQEKHNISNYRLYKELKLNPGNVNAYLKNGNTDKVSVDTARRMLQLAQAQSVNQEAARKNGRSGA